MRGSGEGRELSRPCRRSPVDLHRAGSGQPGKGGKNCRELLKRVDMTGFHLVEIAALQERCRHVAQWESTTLTR
jgi:hypothetical protein